MILVFKSYIIKEKLVIAPPSEKNLKFATVLRQYSTLLQLYT